ncbi:MAG: alpha-E domain-containing protein [Myxococcales bacterium]|nr:alpha-E domain-containing protein [Myxococcales bacterium]
MISRVAESLYWLQRYVERAASTARLMQVTGNTLADAPGLHTWTPVLIVAGEQPRFLELHDRADQEDPEVVQHFLTWDERCMSSIFCSVRAARENARTTRETISREVFQTLNEAWIWLQGPEARALYARDREGFYGRIRALGHEVRGCALATMLRDEPLAFMELGLALERADQTARALDVRHHALGVVDPTLPETGVDMVAWLATLLSCTAYEGYFKRYRGSLRGLRVAEFLLLDPQFPRSVRVCLGDAIARVASLGAPERSLDQLAAGRRLQALRARLEAGGIEELVEEDIHEELTILVDGLAAAAAELYGDFFDPPIASAPTTEVAQ